MRVKGWICEGCFCMGEPADRGYTDPCKEKVIPYPWIEFTYRREGSGPGVKLVVCSDDCIVFVHPPKVCVTIMRQLNFEAGERINERS